MKDMIVSFLRLTTPIAAIVLLLMAGYHTLIKFDFQQATIALLWLIAIYVSEKQVWLAR